MLAFSFGQDSAAMEVVKRHIRTMPVFRWVRMNDFLERIYQKLEAKRSRLSNKWNNSMYELIHIEFSYLLRMLSYLT